MYTTRKIATTLITCLSLSGAGSALAEERPSHFTMKPLHGVSFDLGSKRAVSYFQSEKDACNLVLTYAAEPDFDLEPSFSVSRFEASVPALKTTHYNSSEGDVLQFECQAEAKAMTVRKVKRVADQSGISQ